jgi:hypothetical protein
MKLMKVIDMMKKHDESKISVVRGISIYDEIEKL